MKQTLFVVGLDENTVFLIVDGLIDFKNRVLQERI